MIATTRAGSVNLDLDLGQKALDRAISLTTPLKRFRALRC